MPENSEIDTVYMLEFKSGEVWRLVPHQYSFEKQSLSRIAEYHQTCGRREIRTKRGMRR